MWEILVKKMFKFVNSFKLFPRKYIHNCIHINPFRLVYIILDCHLLRGNSPLHFHLASWHIWSDFSEITRNLVNFILWWLQTFGILLVWDHRWPRISLLYPFLLEPSWVPAVAKLPWGLCPLISPHQHFWPLQQNNAWAMGHQRGDFTGMWKGLAESERRA